jgi:hypothetical protein
MTLPAWARALLGKLTDWRVGSRLQTGLDGGRAAGWWERGWRSFMGRK